jgi:hypothetical protein
VHRILRDPCCLGSLGTAMQGMRVAICLGVQQSRAVFISFPPEDRKKNSFPEYVFLHKLIRTMDKVKKYNV